MGNKIVNIVITSEKDTPVIYSRMIMLSDKLEDRVKDIEEEFKQLIVQLFPESIYDNNLLEVFAKNRHYYNIMYNMHLWIVMSNI